MSIILRRSLVAAVCLCLAVLASAQPATYRKIEYMIPMRDGVRLYTSVYVPTDKPGRHPILLQRTPYSAGPYGPDAMRQNFGGSPKFREAGYIYAYQDVRGRYMSEGEFVHMRPQLLMKWMPHDIDESTDTYDTIEFLINNVPDNNQRVGIWGISYPGGYAALGTIDNHPALKASSPQAPTTDWFLGDDFHHKGVFFLQDAFSFLSRFDGTRVGNPPRYQPIFNFDIEGDAYQFYLNLGPLRETNSERYFNHKSQWWNDMMRNGHFNEFWQARSVQNNMNNITAGVLTVGGWYDAEDLFGPLAIYEQTEKRNPGIFNAICMGPWPHGGWAGGSGDRLGDVLFGSETSVYYREEIEWPFFDAFLRGNGRPDLPEAIMFEGGNNVFRTFDAWPPRAARPATYYFASGKSLSTVRPNSVGHDAYESDPMNPVPYEGGTLRGRSRTYMIADQRFASARPDVLTYQTGELSEDVTWAGPVHANLFIRSTSTDADFVVKIIDVMPAGSTGVNGVDLGGAEILVRAEIMRAKFRDSFSNPTPLKPGQIEKVRFTLPDVLYTFKKGHRIMVQVQSSWFPLADRNPQTFTDIYACGPEAFIKSTIQVHHGGETVSGIEVGILPR